MRLPIPEETETRRLSIQRLRYEDAEEIFYVYASKEECTQFVSWPIHKSILDTRNFLNYAISGWEKGTDYSFGLRLRETGRFVGTFGLMHDEGKIQFGYALGSQYWGHGFATETCIHMMEIVRHLPGVYRVGTFVDTENVASIKVLVKSGLVEEARLQKWFRFVNQNNEPKDCVLMNLPVPDF